MPKVFCCYRREDSRHPAGRIFDHLAAHFGKQEVFKDVDSMPLGLDYRQVLSEQVAKCDILLAIIGDGWLNAADAAGTRRLGNPADFVRIEIESALRRSIPVIPVLVGQAPVPQPEELPESLRELAFRHGIAIRADPDFHHDVERLIRGIKEVLDTRATPGDAANPPTGKVAMPASELAKSGHAPTLGLHTETYLREKVLKAKPRDEVAGVPPGPATGSSSRPASGAVARPRHVVGRRLRWGAALVIALVAALVLAFVAIRIRRALSEAAIAESRYQDVSRTVDDLRRQATDFDAQPRNMEWADTLPPVDYSAFEILSDDRVVDLRLWKPVPPERATELVSAASMTRRVRLRKIHPADDIRFEYRTTGIELFVSCRSEQRAYRVAAQRSESPVGDKITKVRQIAVNVHDVPLQGEFTVQTVATYWNSLQKPDDLWFGAMGYENSYKVSLLVVFPGNKTFKDYRLTVAPTKKELPRPFVGRKILLTPEDRTWLYWEIPDPKPDHVYSLYWDW